MAFKKLLVLCLFFLPNKSFQETKVGRSIASIDVTKGYIGAPLTLRCEAPDFKIGYRRLEIAFYTNLTPYLAFYVTENPTTNSPKTTFYTGINDKVRKYFSSVIQLPNTLTKYEISVVPTTIINSAHFYCKAYYNNGNEMVSNNVSLTVSSPQLTLIGDNTRMRINQPFTVTCSTEQFGQQIGKKYSVKFYSILDGQLAKYEVDATGKQLLSLEEYDNISTSSGIRSSFPTFDLVITEKVARSNQKYWCGLLQSDNSEHESLHWAPVPPFVEFTSSSSPPKGTLTEERGKCSLDEFAQHSTLEYQVQFYSNLGPKTDKNLIAYYLLRPNKMTEFVIEHHTPWSSTVHGDSVAYPNFEIVTKLNGTSNGNNRWWCMLQISQPGQANYRLIRSNMKTL